MVIDNMNYSTQQAVNQVVGTGNASATLSAFGASTKSPAPKGFTTTVDRSFKVTFADGSRATLPFLAAMDRPFRIVGVSTTNGSAISSTSRLCYPLY